jgi:predicted lipid carrier protein YhbT
MNPLADDPESFTLPAAVRRWTARLPQWPPSVVLAAGLSLALGRLIDRAVLQPLCGKRLELHVTDAGLRLRLLFTGAGFVPVFDARPADVRIGASAHDFWLLARRQADPDSLFFRRRLVMEGDTELALLVKNTLDAVDLSAWLPGAGRSARSARAG